MVAFISNEKYTSGVQTDGERSREIKVKLKKAGKYKQLKYM